MFATDPAIDGEVAFDAWLLLRFEIAAAATAFTELKISSSCG